MPLYAGSHGDGSVLVSRKQLAGLAGLQFEGDRDIYEVAGYKQSVTFREYLDRYRRQDIAGRIVDMPAQATWRNAPQVVEAVGEDEDGSETTFAQAVVELEDSSRLYHVLERADRLAGIGEFSVVLLGVPGGDDLSDQMPKGLNGPGDLLYMSVFREDEVEIKEWQDDSQDPRFGQPLIYRIDSESRHDDAPEFEADVHWTRILHFADDLLEDEVFGRPRLQRVFNRLYDLEKITAGSSESYWQKAAPIFQVIFDEDFEVDDDDMEEIDDQLEELAHKIRHVIQWQGAELDVIEGDPTDPSGAADLVMTLIAAASSIPKRILFGSERGELASTQDMREWLARITERQTRFAEPAILRPLLDRFIEHGILPRPEDGYEVEWPDLFELSDQEKAEAAGNWARATKGFSEAIIAGAPVSDVEVREFLELPADRPDMEEEEAFREEEDQASREEVEEAEIEEVA